jgi:hypothetical protein
VKSIRITRTVDVVPSNSTSRGRAHAQIHELLHGWSISGFTSSVTTPVPFPLVQMTTTFLWFYASLPVPFALLAVPMDTGLKSAIARCLEIFIMTFGFIGMEYAGSSDRLIPLDGDCGK